MDHHPVHFPRDKGDDKPEACCDAHRKNPVDRSSHLVHVIPNQIVLPTISFIVERIEIFGASGRLFYIVPHQIALSVVYNSAWKFVESVVAKIRDFTRRHV
jgi:hypothetical protein